MAGFAQLHRIDDPRDRLDKARLWQLIDHARRNGITVVDGMAIDTAPAILIRRELRKRRLTNIQITPPPLGSLPAAPVTSDEAVGVDAADDLARQFKTQPPPPPRAPAPQPEIKRAKPPKYQQRLVPRPPQEINLLRDECKRLGIKMDRRDGKEALKAKIEAHKASNGQDAPQLRQ